MRNRNSFYIGLVVLLILFSLAQSLTTTAQVNVAAEGMQNISEVKLMASDGARYDEFGASVALSGEVAIVGVPYDDDHGSSSGAAYIYRWNGNYWQEEAKLTASDGEEEDYFGNSVSISGNVAIVGAPYDDESQMGAGAAYLFRWNGKLWQEEAKLTISDAAESERFGSSVSLSGDVALIGSKRGSLSNQMGLAYLFAFDGNSWQESSRLQSSDGVEKDGFGSSVSLDGDVALVAATLSHTGASANAVYVYRWNGLNWIEEAKLSPNDGEEHYRFGNSIAVSNDVVIVGSYGDNDYGFQSGAAYFFRWDGVSWQQEARLTASDGQEYDSFGRSVAIHGDMALIGAPFTDDQASSSGSAYLFSRNESEWIETTKLITSDGSEHDHFGLSVALSEGRALVGAKSDDDQLLGLNTGSAYLYHLSAGNVPDIALSATSLMNVVTVGETNTHDTLTIINRGTEPLSWSLNEESNWLSVTPLSGTVPPEGSQSITILSDGSQLMLGQSYTSTLTITSNDPDESLLTIPLLFKVIPPESKLVPSDNVEDDRFAYSLSISGEVALIGAVGDDTDGENSGAAYIFRQDENGWQEEAKLKANDANSDDQFGISVAVDGDLALIGANANNYWTSKAGSVYIFRFNGQQWQQEAKLTTSDEDAAHAFGRAVAIADDVVVIGSHEDGYYGEHPGVVYIFRRDGDTWNQEAKLTSPNGMQENDFGQLVATNGDKVLITDTDDKEEGSYSGAVYVYGWNGNDWAQEAKLTANNGTMFTKFGVSLSLSGNIVLIRGEEYDEKNGFQNTAYIYRFDGSHWEQEAQLFAGYGKRDYYHQNSVSIDGNMALVGVYWDDDNGEDAGASYLYRYHQNSWQEVTKLLATDGDRQDDFGSSVSLSGNTLLIGAIGDDENGSYSGSAYMYKLARPNISPQNVSLTLSPGEQSTDTLTITNHSTDTLDYSLTEDAAWLDITPQNGSVAPQNSQRLTLTIDATNLKAGSYSHTLSLSTTHPDYESVDIPITLTVTEATSITLSGLSATSPSGAPGGLMLMMLGLGWFFWKEGVQSLLCQLLGFWHVLGVF